jgi:hypothetical protein
MNYIFGGKDMLTQNQIVLERARALLEELKHTPEPDNPTAKHWNDAFREGVREQEQRLAALVEEEHKQGLGGRLP